MTYTMMGYSAIFMRFAWMVQPRNYLLFACHLFNIGAQSYQLARGLKYQNEVREKAVLEALATGKPIPVFEDFITPQLAAAIAVSTLGMAIAGKHMKRSLNTMALGEPIKKFLNHPAGIFTVHGWAPIFKWALSITNIIEYDRPVEKISTMQQTALAATGFIWSRYSLVITPKNYSLFAVNFILGLTGAYHLSRKLYSDIAGAPKVKALEATA